MKRTLLCGFLVLSATSCQSGGAKSTLELGRESGPRSDLRERAQRYWQARVDHKWETLYEYLEPWQRASGTPVEYETWAKESEPFNVLSFEIKKVEEEGPYGWIHVDYQSTLRTYPDAPPRQAQIIQKWQAEGGAWVPVPGQLVDAYPISPSLRDLKAEAELKKRFDLAWEARHARQWEKLYQLTDPRDRDDVSPAEYAESEGLFDYISRDLKWLEAVGDKGKVRVLYQHKVTDPNLTKLPPKEAEITEHWVKVNNEWYRELKP